MADLSHKEWTGNMLVYYDKEGNVLGTSEFEIFKDYDIAIQFSKGESWQRRRWARTHAEIANCTLLYAINDVGLAGGCDGDTLLELVASSILLARSQIKMIPRDDPRKKYDGWTPTRRRRRLMSPPPRPRNAAPARRGPGQKTVGPATKKRSGKASRQPPRISMIRLASGESASRQRADRTLPFWFGDGKTRP